MSPILSASRVRVMWAALFVLLAGWLAFANTAAASGPVHLYDGKWQWQNWSWGSTIGTEKAWPIYEGKPSISVQFNEEWAGVRFAKDGGISTSGYTHLQFMMHPNGKGVPALQAVLHGTDGKVIKTVPVVYYAKPAQHGWFSVSIPLADLDGVDKKISWVSLQQRHGSTTSFNLAAVQFVKDHSKKEPKHDNKAPADFVAPVFDDKILWDNWSWNTKSFVQHGPAYNGKAFLSVNYMEPWAGLSFRSDGFVSGYTSLKFAMHANGGPVPSLRAIVYDKSGEIGNIHVTKYITDIKNGWYEVSIPLSALGASEKEITRVALQEGTGSKPLYTFHVDDLRFSRP